MNSPITIVLVEREQLLLDLLTSALQSDDLKVYGVTDVDQGRQLVKMHSPALLVVDFGISEVVAFLESSRRDNPSGTVLALIDSDEMRVKCVNAGMGAAVIDRRQGFDALAIAMQEAVGAFVPSLMENGQVRILIVDDDEPTRIFVASFLRRNYAVTTASDGNQAIECIASDPSIAVVLLDISMPAMGGLETLRMIVSREPHPVVIMATGVADHDVAQLALKIGAADYILKPFALPSIESSIVACLSRDEFRKQPWWKR